LETQTEPEGAPDPEPPQNADEVPDAREQEAGHVAEDSPRAAKPKRRYRRRDTQAEGEGA
jgi:hypothetical protein